MKIAIFGANGPTGHLLTKQALAQEHIVRAVTRHPEAFLLHHEHLQVMRADVFDLREVEAAVAGQDAVLSALGVPYSFKPIIIATLGRTMYADMKRMETLVRTSRPAWMVIRSNGLFETEAVTAYQMAQEHIRGLFPSRADLADCMLHQLTTDQYVQKIVAVGTVEGTPNFFEFFKKEAFKRQPKPL